MAAPARTSPQWVMVTLADRIVRVLRTTSRPMDDDELAGRIGVIRQAVNQACRRLEAQGSLRRYVGPNNKIVDEIVDEARGFESTPTQPHPTRPSPPAADSMSMKSRPLSGIISHCPRVPCGGALGPRPRYGYYRHRIERTLGHRGEGRGRQRPAARQPLPWRPGRADPAHGRSPRTLRTRAARYSPLPRAGRRMPALARVRLALTVFFIHRDGTVTQEPDPR